MQGKGKSSLFRRVCPELTIVGILNFGQYPGKKVFAHIIARVMLLFPAHLLVGSAHQLSEVHPATELGLMNMSDG